MDKLIAELRSTTPKDSGYAEMANAAADKIEKLRAVLQLWLDYDNYDEADFSKVGPLLMYAEALEATRAAMTQ